MWLTLPPTTVFLIVPVGGSQGSVEKQKQSRFTGLYYAHPSVRERYERFPYVHASVTKITYPKSSLTKVYAAKPNLVPSRCLELQLPSALKSHPLYWLNLNNPKLLKIVKVLLKDTRTKPLVSVQKRKIQSRGIAKKSKFSEPCRCTARGCFGLFLRLSQTR